jgi:hypothetical protein
MTRTRLLFYGALMLAALAASANGEPRVKFIQLGWDIPDTAFLAANHQQMEREAPFDGVIFRFEGRSPDGQPISSETAWSTKPWQRDWLKPALADLKSCRFDRFRHNFVRFNTTPNHIAWDDDAGWATLADKAGHCAWLAREGGAAGLAPDFEPYGANQWKWDPAKGRTFADTAALARQRGEQFARAITAEYPRAVVLTLFANSLFGALGREADPEPGLKAHPYGLLPAFWDGMIAGAGPDMVLVDGCENGYYFQKAAEVQTAALDMLRWSGASMRLVSPANRTKARRQTQAGFGCYLDMYINPPDSPFYRDGIDGSRLKRFEQHLTALRNSADEYVWFYGEQCRWWSGLTKDGPWREAQLANTIGKGRTWEESFPGVTAMIDRLRDPLDWARRQTKSARPAGAAPNLLHNGDFAQPPTKESTAVPHWQQWQDKPLGLLEHDPAVGHGSARATRVAWGCFLQEIPAHPGQTYYLRGRSRNEGAGVIRMTVRWQTANGAWTHETDDRMITFARPDPNGWSTAEGVVVVPQAAGKLLVLLDVRDQTTEADRAWFDDIEAVRLD